MKALILFILLLSLRVSAQTSAGTIVSTLPETTGEKRLSFESEFWTLSLISSFASDLEVDGEISASTGSQLFKLPMKSQAAIGFGVDYYRPMAGELGWYIGGRYEGRREISAITFDQLGTVSDIDLGGSNPSLSLVVLRAGMASYVHPKVSVFLGPNVTFPLFNLNGSSVQISANGLSTELEFGPNIGLNAGLQYIAHKRFLVELSYNSSALFRTYEFESQTGGSSVFVNTTAKLEGVMLSLRYMVL